MCFFFKSNVYQNNECLRMLKTLTNKKQWIVKAEVWVRASSMWEIKWNWNICKSNQFSASDINCWLKNNYMWEEIYFFFSIYYSVVIWIICKLEYNKIAWFRRINFISILFVKKRTRKKCFLFQKIFFSRIFSRLYILDYFFSLTFSCFSKIFLSLFLFLFSFV